MNSELLRSGLVAAGFTVLLFVGFVILYWAFRGFLPGSRVVEQIPVAPADIDGTTARLRLFYVGWCPYSREALDKVKELEGLLKQTTYGDKRVVVEYVDCETRKDECALYSVEAYPTYKLETSVKMFEYVGPASTTAYRKFLGDALGKEETTE